MIDRIFLGGVRDFIAIGSFPIFNVADILLTCSLILL
ncbi:signal peptidase II [bacterium]|nr:signal peptidase II [bacterium]